MRRHLSLLCALMGLLGAAAAGCSDEETGPDPGPCDPTAEKCSYAHDFGEITVAAGEERSGVCQSWTLNNPTELWVTTVEYDNDGVYHHGNWFFVPDNDFELPDGAWSCRDHDFDEFIAAILGGVLYAQSTQVRHEVQTFPQGAAVRIPPWSRMIGNTHLLNASDQAMTTGLRLAFDTIPPAELSVKLTPFQLSYFDLHIAPEKRTEATATCDLRQASLDTLGTPLSLDLYYALPHYHALGDLGRLQLLGGDRDGETLLEVEGFDAESHNKTFDPPLRLTEQGGYGLSFTCGWTNPRPVEVGQGIGDQEMCDMLGFADVGMAFRAGVDSGQQLGEAPDGTELWGGPCSVAAFPYFHDKEGGPPR